jgi:ABC-type transport system involved in cytochrome c biogenesis permease subunit
MVVWVPFELIHKFLGVFWKEAFPTGESAWAGSFPFPAGQLVGGAMLINLLAAHAMRFRLSWKRSGIFLIHGGLLLLFVGEFITREYAVEQRMTIDEGKSVNYAEDVRHVELAFSDRSDPNANTVVTVPQHMLQKPKGRITHPDLPVDVEVVEYMTNSALERAKSGGANPADSGLGKMWTASKRAEVSGVDPNQKVDMPAVYVKLYKKGTDEALGTYLAALYAHLLGGDDELEVDGKKIDLMLRFKRYYKPFRVHLDKFRFDRYTGTEKAKNYSSDVRVTDEADQLIIPPRRIAMNEPLRYNGETFYQADFDHQTEKGTVLQVVKNPGWLLPYISCVVVGLGLVIHFSIYLLRFLRSPARKPAESPVALAPSGVHHDTGLSPTTRFVPVVGRPLLALSAFGSRRFPWIVLGVMTVYLLSVFGRMAPVKEPVDYDAAGRMVVHEGGRAKPLDTVARIHLRMISGIEEFEDTGGKKQPAIRWYLDVLAGGTQQQRNPVWDYKVIRIDNEAVLRALGFQNRSGFRYSLNEIAPKIDVIEKRMAAIEKKVSEGKKLDTDETKFKELRDRLTTLMELASFGGPLLLPPQNGLDWTTIYEFRLEAQVAATKAAILDAQARLRASGKLEKLTPEDEQKLIEVIHEVDLSKVKLDPDKRAALVEEAIQLLRPDPQATETMLRERMKGKVPEARILATVNKALREQFEPALALLSDAERKAVTDLAERTRQTKLAARPAYASWEKLLTAYREKNAGAFAAAVAEYRTTDAATVRDTNPTNNIVEWVLYAPFNGLGRNRVEVTFNRFAPFYQCSGLYVMVFILTVLGFTQQAAGRPHWAAALRRSALWLLLLTLAVHTVALFARMYIMERPMVFVTNLYSSAVFIGWGCVALGLLLELIFKMGIGNLLAAVLGLATCIVAHNLATDDTLEMMQAVLDTNFWLATHVTTITLGYMATFFAGFLGALYVFQMLGAVIRDSYESTGEPTVGALVAFGAAATGAVGVPLFFLWFATSALDKFELLPSVLLWGLFWLTVAAGVMYAVGLMLLRVASDGVDAQGKPRAGRVPGLAAPVVAMGLTPERSKIFGQMVYGVVCFATMLCFIGTVLGGIWADQSWGRFWGWDPKENGAILLVLWNSLILHARWAGLVKDRGVAVLAIFGNVLTAWSWFGTNQLSIGLHAYGFDSRLADGCFNFWLSQLLILGWGLIPQHFWASATRRAVPVAAPTSASGAAAPPSSGNAPPAANGQPQPPSNGQANGAPNGHPNGHPRHGKGRGKKHGRRH